MRCRVLLLVLACAAAGTATADDCQPTDTLSPGRDRVQAALQGHLDLPPEEVYYCAGEYPRWVVRWAVFERHDGWRKYASAVCMELEQPMTCRLQRHVVVPDSHEVIDLPYDIAMPQVVELFRAAKALQPKSEVARIEHVVVADGGAWSEEKYGYVIWYLEPPEFRDGAMQELQRQCGGDECRWLAPALARSGGWIPSSGDRWLRD